ncbi:conserved hypothetical protein [delta proteobacterium NaphS2]|nr:conserved hypothetical protein [delta proteobacterium NaphS2]EFK08284.1 conserved hypothetical protein [delta proteobacterium NaphS2]
MGPENIFLALGLENNSAGPVGAADCEQMLKIRCSRANWSRCLYDRSPFLILPARR